jgi:hypothetical protein
MFERFLVEQCSFQSMTNDQLMQHLTWGGGELSILTYVRS